MEVRNRYLDPRYLQGVQFEDDARVRVALEDVDEPPVFARKPYVLDVHEDTAAGSLVGVVSARDPDTFPSAVK